MKKLIIIDSKLGVNPYWVEAVNFDADKQETVIYLRGGNYMEYKRTRVSFKEVINKLNQGD